MFAKRRTAIAGLLLIGLLTGCSGIRGEGVFAFRDHEGRAAICDLASRPVIWRSDCAVHTRPEWSPKGDFLGFAYAGPSDGNTYLGYVELPDMTVVKVGLNEPAEVFLKYVPELGWSPSGSLLMVDSPGEHLEHTVFVLDTQTGSVIRRFIAWGDVLWSPDGKRICYPVLRDKSASTDRQAFDLVSLDLRSGRTKILFSGEPGNWILPYKWTDTVVFGYGTPVQGSRNYVIRHLEGRNRGSYYELFKDSSSRYSRPPEAVTVGLGRPGVASCSGAGAWLVEVYQPDSWWVYYSPDDSIRAVKLVRGDGASWRPAPD